MVLTRVICANLHTTHSIYIIEIIVCVCLCFANVQIPDGNSIKIDYLFSLYRANCITLNHRVFMQNFRKSTEISTIIFIRWAVVMFYIELNISTVVRTMSLMAWDAYLHAWVFVWIYLVNTRFEWRFALNDRFWFCEHQYAFDLLGVNKLIESQYHRN